MTKGIIIAGFAGIGKTTLAKKYKNVIDLESSNFKYLKDSRGLTKEELKGRKDRVQNLDWPTNYINEIKKQIELNDIILVCPYLILLPLYEKEGLDYILCYPDKESLNIYKERFKNRGNNDLYIKTVFNSFKKEEAEWQKKAVKKIILKGNETLEEYLLTNNYKLQI